MARYTIAYACGHSEEKQLFGPTRDRTSKIEWLERGDCPQCWAAKKRETDAQQPITCAITLPMMDPGADAAVQLCLLGGTVNKKEQIKALGFTWGEPAGGVLDFLGMGRGAKWCWHKCVSVEALPAELKLLEGLAAELKASYDPLDMAMARQRHAAFVATQARVAAIDKPQRPACWPAGRWNGNIYAGVSGAAGRIYVNGEQVLLQKEEKAALLAYQGAVAAYKQAVAAAKRETEVQHA